MSNPGPASNTSANVEPLLAPPGTQFVGTTKQVASDVLDASGNVTGSVGSSGLKIPIGTSYKTAQRQRDRLLELENRALIQAPVWATGTAYVAGQILRYGSSNPALIVATNAGTSGASLGTFSSQATFTDGTVTFVFTGRISGLANSSGREIPTISTSGTIPGGTSELNFSPLPAGVSAPVVTNVFNTGGGVNTVYWYDSGSSSNVTTAGVGLYAVTAVFEFVCDDPVLALSNQFGTITNTPIVYVGEVDGSDMCRIEESITPANSSAPSYYIITWPGGRRERRYRVELANVPGSNIRGLCRASLSDIWAPPIDGLRCLVIDDSRAVTESPATITDSSQYRPVRMAKLAGLRLVQCMGQGGAGYVVGSTPWHNGPNSAPLNLVFQNNTNLAAIQFDVVIFVVGGNDIGQVSSLITTNALYCFQQARAVWPNARMIVFGPDDGRNNLSTSALACEAAILAAFNQWVAAGETNAKFLPVLNDARGCEIVGTGNMGATNGSGNSDWYIGTDSTHPPRFGHEYIARRRAYQIDQDLTSVGL